MTQFQKGQSGNPTGRPKGIKDRRTRVREAFEEHSEALVSKAIEMAMENDTIALRMCLDRIVAPLKSTGSTVAIDLTRESSLTEKGAQVIEHLSTGDITTSEAQDIMATLQMQGRIIELTELVQRVEALENETSR